MGWNFLFYIAAVFAVLFWKHVITVPQELRRLQSYRTLEFDRNGYSNWNALQQNAKKEFESSGCALYSLQ